jgi:hypothetical protein
LRISSQRGSLFAPKAPKDAYILGDSLKEGEKLEKSRTPETPKEAYTKGDADYGAKDKIAKTRRAGFDTISPTQSNKAKPWVISIVDIDYDINKDLAINRPRSIDLYFMPREVIENPTSTFATLAPLGRNNPHYQFVGSEDTLEFEVDWHSLEEDRKDVISNVKWLQALTKASDWRDQPHRVMLVWSDNPLIWRDDTWILVSASTRYTQFEHQGKVHDPNMSYGKMKTKNSDLLPVQAYQKLTFKKVSQFNLKADDIGMFTKIQNHK